MGRCPGVAVSWTGGWASARHMRPLRPLKWCNRTRFGLGLGPARERGAVSDEFPGISSGLVDKTSALLRDAVGAGGPHFSSTIRAQMQAKNSDDEESGH